MSKQLLPWEEAAEFRKSAHPAEEDGPWNDSKRETIFNLPAKLPKRANPSEGMSATDKMLVGAGAALDRTYRGVRGLLPPGLLPKDLVGGTGEEDAKVYQANHPGGWATAGELGTDMLLGGATGAGAMSVASRAPLLAKTLAARPIASAVGGNAAYAALTSPEDRLQAAGYGAAGAALPFALGRLAQGVRPGPEAQKLLNAGVQPTLGQVMSERGTVMGRTFSRAEEAAQSLPVVGPAIRNMRDQAMTDWQQATRSAVQPGAKSVDELTDYFTSEYAKRIPTGNNSVWAQYGDGTNSIDLLLQVSAKGLPVTDEQVAAVSGLVKRMAGAELNAYGPNRLEANDVPRNLCFYR